MEKVNRIGFEFSTDSLIVKVYRSKLGSISEVISLKFGCENLVLLVLFGAGSPIVGVLLSVATMKLVLRVMLFGLIVVFMFQVPEISIAKIGSLLSYYGFRNDDSIRFFQEHSTLDRSTRLERPKV